MQRRRRLSALNWRQPWSPFIRPRRNFRRRSLPAGGLRSILVTGIPQGDENVAEMQMVDHLMPFYGIAKDRGVNMARVRIVSGIAFNARSISAPGSACTKSF